ncbi:MAG: TIGR02757 family protein [Cyclobacteriaceae bacterium]|jgi:uncharacterized protein (TIGR02757 family)
MTAARVAGLREFLDLKVEQYNRPGFITHDPISVPHRFRARADIEIAGFFAALLAWGQRVTVINNCNRLLQWMDDAPHQFVLHHTAADLKPFTKFVHRTFNGTDAHYLIRFLGEHYRQHASLEPLFVPGAGETVEHALVRFHHTVFSLPGAPARTRKHIATPARKSACKRLNMYLRWMVRHDHCGVDFGLWKQISPAQLICPLDVHVERVARQLKLVKRKTVDWAAAVELTGNLRLLDANDPVKYDFALFGLGVEGEM